MNWHQIKDWLELATGLNMDALHVHGGIAIQLAVAALLRRSLRSPIPWLVVLACALLNEGYDLHYEVWPNRGDQWMESIRDVWNTLLLPTLFLLLARYAPGVLTGRTSRPDPNVSGRAGGS